ncbi:MAG: NAD(P)/FAD-dependent oxidoreductase [Caldilineaceae bacterium]|nr:NAD(P)/FAD-dependent oxidoreductase [Caldilineaceae bacterium]
MPDFDVLFVGTGHNALVCAGYLAQAGYHVGMLEGRSTVGGAVVTQEVIPGYRFDLGGSAHILIHHTPIVRDLCLEEYGLSYIDLDPLFFAPFPDGTRLFVWKDLDRTCESIAAVSQEDAANYYQYVNDWSPLAEAMVESFMLPPTPLNVVKTLGFQSGVRKDLRRLSAIFGGYGKLLRTSFVSPQVQAVIGWMAAQSGPPPTERLSGPFALWHPMYHRSGVKRPRGGSGMLTEALARMIRAHGGSIATSCRVERILVESGRAVGVRTEEGDLFTAKRAVVSGAHIHTTLKLLAEQVPSARIALARRSRVGNGFGMMVRFAMNALPDYAAGSTFADGGSRPEHRALQFICPDLDYLDRAYGDFLGGRPSEDPALIAMSFSAVDSTLAPPGKHVLFLWGQYFPYELASGGSWDDIGDEIADRMLAKLAEYAPNVAGAVVGRLVQTPLWLERELGLLRGNVMHLEMSVNQMFTMRPALGMSNYRGPAKSLYLTGASTHPGGGIMGAAGRNAAAVLLHDLSRKPHFTGL